MEVNNFDYLINITNTDQLGQSESPPLIFSETREEPFINQPSRYKVAITRFSLESPTLPVFIPVIETNQNDINKTVYKISLTFNYGGSERIFTQSVIWVPQNLSATAPTAPFSFQDFKNKYWYCYSIQHFTDCLNKAFIDAFNGLNSLVVGLGGSLPTSNPPFLEVNPTDGNFILNSDVLAYNSSLVNPIKIYLNTPLYGLLNSFDAIFYGSIATPKNYMLKIRNSGTNTFIISSTYSALQTYTECSPIPNWNPVASVVFTSNSLPIVPTITSHPYTLSRSSNYFNSSVAGNPTQRIITDFEVGLTTGLEYKSIIQYQPASQWRYIDMTGNQPLNKIDIAIYWKDRYGNLHDFFLFPNCNVNILFHFEKRY
jgi:hypothetical protein